MMLFTQSFPWDGAAEGTFLLPELEHLKERFAAITLIPEQLQGTQVNLSCEIAVDETFAATLKSVSLGQRIRIILKHFRHPGPLLHEVISQPLVSIHPRRMGRLLIQFSKARTVETWLDAWMKKNNISPSETIGYTYWFTSTTLGLTWYKIRHHNFTVISRAHGHDVYAKRHVPPYIPLQCQALSGVDRLFPTSEAARRYLAKRCPAFTDKLVKAYIGVNDPGATKQQLPGEPYRLVSCSSIVPVKRLELLLSGIAELGLRNPARLFEWVHIGDGPGRPGLEKLAAQRLPANILWRFFGYLDNRKVLDFYRSLPIVAFLNVSESEGLPVSIMEAQSFGIPVIATAVGGNSEIVSNENGILLDPFPKSSAVAAAIESLLIEQTWRSKSTVSRENWQQRFDARKNHAAFTDEIYRLAIGMALT